MRRGEEKGAGARQRNERVCGGESASLEGSLLREDREPLRPDRLSLTSIGGSGEYGGWRRLRAGDALEEWRGTFRQAENALFFCEAGGKRGWRVSQGKC